MLPDFFRLDIIFGAAQMLFSFLSLTLVRLLYFYSPLIQSIHAKHFFLLHEVEMGFSCAQPMRSPLSDIIKSSRGRRVWRAHSAVMYLGEFDHDTSPRPSPIDDG